MNEYIVLSAVLYWTFAVATFAIAVNTLQRDSDDYFWFALVGIPVFWPLVAVLAVPLIIYRGFVNSATTIRNDMKNRGLVKEFDEFLANKRREENETK